MTEWAISVLVNGKKCLRRRFSTLRGARFFGHVEFYSAASSGRKSEHTRVPENLPLVCEHGRDGLALVIRRRPSVAVSSSVPFRPSRVSAHIRGRCSVHASVRVRCSIPSPTIASVLLLDLNKTSP